MIRCLLLMTVCFPLPAAEAPGTLPSVTDESIERVVKLSSSGTCYTADSDFYNKILNFTPYPSIEACLKAGGHLASQQKDAGWGVIDCNSPDLETLGLKYMCADPEK